MNKQDTMTDRPLAVAFGGGTNSTAMLCGFRERGIKPDLITFADTGGEAPHTYEHVMEMDTQCRVWWGVGIETVRRDYQGEFEGLEGNCLRKKMLPSLAYGTKGCSMKYKVDPQNKRLLKFMDECGAKEITKAIGYDAGEGHRRIQRAFMEHPKGRVEHFWYPLVEWEWRRVDCVEAIKRHGLTQPGKSSCFFCPAMKRGEILRLKDEHPDLLKRALAMESNAVTRNIKGLGGNLKWADLVSNDEQQVNMWSVEKFWDENDPLPLGAGVPCGCYDG